MRYKVIIIGIANDLKTGINIMLEIIKNIFSVFSNLLMPSSFIDIKGSGEINSKEKRTAITAKE
jgi:hypothetical protein